MNRKYSLLLVLITAIFELAFWYGQGRITVPPFLTEKNMRCRRRLNFKDFYDRNYIAVNVPITETKWEGEREPETETIYLVISKGQKGALILDHAQLTQPPGNYIKTRALRIMDGTVYFNFPADRMYMAPEQLKKLSVVELSERVQVPEDNGKTKTAMKNEITALVRVKDGRAAISRVLANGGPVEQIFTTVGKNLSVKYATSKDEKDQYNEKDSLPLLIWIRMVKNRIINRNKEAAMYLILMRHGEAVPQTEDVPNRERRLTKEGKKQVRTTSRMLARFLKDRPLRIFASPFMRTRQTARILSEECFAEGLHLTEELLQGDFRRIENHLMTDGGPLALVGHHPFLQSYLLEAAGAGIQPDLASISVVDYDMAWKQENSLPISLRL